MNDFIIGKYTLRVTPLEGGMSNVEIFTPNKLEWQKYANVGQLRKVLKEAKEYIVTLTKSNIKVYGHVYQELDGSYTVTNWDHTSSESFATLVEARESLMSSIWDGDSESEIYTSPLMEVRIVSNEHKAGMLVNYTLI